MRQIWKGDISNIRLQNKVDNMIKIGNKTIIMIAIIILSLIFGILSYIYVNRDIEYHIYLSAALETHHSTNISIYINDEIIMEEIQIIDVDREEGPDEIFHLKRKKGDFIIKALEIDTNTTNSMKISLESELTIGIKFQDSSYLDKPIIHIWTAEGEEESY